MAKKQCSNGHIYDSAIYGEDCPFCSTQNNTSKTVIDNSGKTVISGSNNVGNFGGETQIGTSAKTVLYGHSPEPAPVARKPDVLPDVTNLESPAITIAAVEVVPSQQVPQEGLKTSNSGVGVEVNSIADTVKHLETKLSASEKKQKILAGWLITFILISLGSVIAGVYEYNGMVNEYNSLYDERDIVMNERNRLQIYYNKLQSDYNFILENNAPIRIDSLLVGNVNNGKWLTQPGENLYAYQIRYLEPRITYTSVVNENVTFSIKIIEPNGVVFRNAQVSPQGYTYSTQERVTAGRHTLDLTGWGNGGTSSYWPGTWTIEVWYKGLCLKSEKVTLY